MLRLDPSPFRAHWCPKYAFSRLRRPDPQNRAQNAKHKSPAKTQSRLRPLIPQATSAQDAKGRGRRKKNFSLETRRLDNFYGRLRPELSRTITEETKADNLKSLLQGVRRFLSSPWVASLKALFARHGTHQIHGSPVRIVDRPPFVLVI